MSEVKRNRTLASDLDWLLVAIARYDARIDLSVDEQTMEIIAQLLHDRLPKPVVGRGKTAREAIRELRDELERLIKTGRRRR